MSVDLSLTSGIETRRAGLDVAQQFEMQRLEVCASRLDRAAMD